MIHIYTGDGKGKTTAAIGLAVRALGAGMRVAFFQFMKAWEESELIVLQNFDNIIIDRSWDGRFIKEKASDHQKKMVFHQFHRAKKTLQMPFDLIILDEIIVAMHFGLLREEDILALMQSCPKNKELVLTGQKATQKLIDKADLVTEMKKIKHYFDRGLMARKGIEF
ncbi:MULTISPECIES: cob(I)yrinic acid a,c-diamide adenosyltransferase [unclassified Nitratiruptor]|uniref:cob(I)yrinic acid a,c-diamide adenosyltransferase n=1 Tax=unclassified Nitratiruptor TaxID=2624044 RepID=UPI001916888A|nr:MULTISPECIES: cob(I)yrinic acid a,c-diamide adenosyltransferase [unclassified Nitratiruptor]BCD59852.1 cob(I)alamin adenosyltransferase [Nitratiruptor sp. YY08-10]BCD63775.1 cob(I)alamin adenosyltransferase [Nitratiruptor sp. YY08-14]